MSDDDNVVIFPGETYHDLPPNRILEQAMKQGLKQIVLLGVDDEGEFYIAACNGDAADVVFMLEQAKLALLSHHTPELRPRGDDPA